MYVLRHRKIKFGMEQDSVTRLGLLHPKLVSIAKDAYADAVHFTPVGVHPYVVQTLRTFPEQDFIYQQGRTRPGPIVTNAKPGQTYHNYGLAFDFCNQVNGKLRWVVDKNWMIVVDIFKSYGFKWGGDWKSIKDYPHFELTFGYNWRELLLLHNSGKVDENGYVLI